LKMLSVIRPARLRSVVVGLAKLIGDPPPSARNDLPAGQYGSRQDQSVEAEHQDQKRAAGTEQRRSHYFRRGQKWSHR
jgi:hypothetical protein